MAVPTTLQQWRAHLRHGLPHVELLNQAELDRLASLEREAYDEQRWALLSCDLVLPTRQVTDTTRVTELALRQLAGATATARRGIVLSGPSTLGKSTTLLSLGRYQEAQWRKSRGMEKDTQYAPVMYAVVPPAATPRSLMRAFAAFFDPTGSPRTQSLELLTDLVVREIRQARTSLVLVDEAHNLTSNRQHGQAAASVLKQLAERVDAIFVYAGVNMPNSDLFAGDIGRQMAGRMAMREAEPINLRTTEGAQEWINVVDGLDRARIRLARHEPGSLAANATELYHLTGGSIGTLTDLLRDAANTAIMDNTERITLDTLRSMPVDIQAARHSDAANKAARNAATEAKRTSSPGKTRPTTRGRGKGNLRSVPSP